MDELIIVGGGLAGSEAAWQAASAASGSRYTKCGPLFKPGLTAPIT